VLNKIDLPGAEPDRVQAEIEEVIGIDASNAVRISAKTGLNVPDVLEAIVQRVPPPQDSGEYSVDSPLRALVFDSWFDPYYGVVALVRVFSGSVKKGDKMRLAHTGKEFDTQKVNYFTPKMSDAASISVGEVGAIITGLKDVRDVKVGDTILKQGEEQIGELKGFKEVKPMVFCGVYPIESDDYANLRDALEKLKLNDSAFTFEPETSNALGFGFRCGFLGLLHMEVFQERLERQYNLSIISTAPSVVYKVTTTRGEELLVDNPSKMPTPTEIAKIEEPYIKCTVHTPNEFVGAVLAMFQERRGNQIGIDYITSDRVQVKYEMPLSEMVFDFFDRLKSSTRGYASMDYELIDYREGDMVKLDIMLNGEPVDALSVMIHRSKAANRGRELAKKLKELIERQMYEVAIQASIGSKIVARETLSAFRKNVIAKCYGGDISRKRKLLEKQKEGKKRMKQIGSVEVPQEAFLAVLKVD
jgi:GTP-binding protein LepA